MMKRTKPKAPRTRLSKEYKDEALTLAEQVGVKAAAEQLGLHDLQLYGWRSKAQASKVRGEVNDELARENARLRRQLAEKEQALAFVGKAAAYFAKGHK
jgi:transposase